MRRVTFVCLITFLSLSIACSRKPSDETIAQNIEKKIAADPDTNHTNVTVEAKDGIVHLKGTADTESARTEVEKIANKEPGVASVDNQVSVEPEQTAQSRSGPRTTPAVERVTEPPTPPPPPKPIVVPAGT